MVTEYKGDDGARRVSQRMRRVAVFGPVLAAFAIVTAAAAIAAYRFGEGVIYLHDRTISELTFFEVTGGAALGVIGAIVALAMAAIGAVGALVAAIIGGAVAMLGLALGAVVTLGVVTGPVLLVVIVGILIKRRFWPDVI